MPTKKPIFMETTEVPAERTAAEISNYLIQAGATQIACDYDSGKIKGLRWMMRVAGGRDLMFAMPARVDPVYKILLKRKGGRVSQKEEAALRAKSERVAWRQLLRWIQAQIAMIDAGMSEATEIFFPYMVHPLAGKTVYSFFAEQEFRMLPAPEKPQ